MPSQQGDPEAFKDVFERYKKPLSQFIGFLPFVDKEDVEDIAGETWEKAWKTWSCIDSVSNLKAWLCKIAFHTAIDYARKRKRRRENRMLRYLHPKNEQNDGVEREIPDPDTFENHVECKIILDAAWNKTLKRITHKQGCAYIRYRIRGEPLVEVAQSLNISTYSVTVYCSAVNKIFREEYRRLLEGDWHNE